MTSYLTHLECALCGKTYEADRLQRMCADCARPLLARYDLSAVRSLGRGAAVTSEPTMWRYRALLPVRDREAEVGLGEGFTPLLHARRLGAELGLSHLYIKDESLNPTGSFKARGLAVAISRACELGVREVVIPSAGNAAGAMAAYAARAGLRAHVYMPTDAPAPFRLECEALGAEVTLVEGLITDCGREARQAAEAHGWFDLSTLKEPYRLEGKKTMGYELAEQFGWGLPDVIIYPTGGGTGIIGMWKAFGELGELGWIGDRRPRMVTVQSAGCAPIVRAFHARGAFAAPWEGAETVAAGLRVPSAVGDFLILRTLRESDGTAVAVSDEALVEAQLRIARLEGVFACPEGGATLAALEVLLAQGWISPEERIVLFNTGTGLKYPGVGRET
ncbi:MAG TPA: threonine synthase [Anaerolineales bacterium]|nr:threonine synthase [Anaerolineae bacterium]HIQ01828.1 threonine synthase [Anaerolineales bacterium]